MKNILLISFALVLICACDNSNPAAVDTSCIAGGCTATACASDCACGCDGAGGDNCTCSTNCACASTCTAGGCTATACASDCACGCDGAGGDNCTCSTSCACVNDDGDSSTSNAVSLDGFAFSPSTLTISVGETVAWTLNASHTVVSDDFTPVAGPLSTYSHQFDTAGEFGYKCGNHSTMTGTIIVQ